MNGGDAALNLCGGYLETVFFSAPLTFSWLFLLKTFVIFFHIGCSFLLHKGWWWFGVEGGLLWGADGGRGLNIFFLKPINNKAYPSEK